jgi:N-acetylglutamate synthase-like GNAT family acetyltransferase
MASEHLRIARPEDHAAVGDLLNRSYSILMTPTYPADLLALALPLLTRANATLLASGRYAVIESEDGVLTACGGWSRERPGSGEVTPGLAHIRHFAIDPTRLRRGRGRRLYAWCEDAARGEGMTAFECHSSRNAEPFYRALGFARVKPFDIDLGVCVIEAVLMTRKI